MFGILLSLNAALMDSIKNVFMKKSLQDVGEHMIAWVFRTVPLLVLVPILLIMGIPEIGTSFWVALLISGVLNVVATLLFVKSIKLEEISLVIPLISFTPVFLLVTSPLILNELPPLTGILGVLLVALGSYCLHMEKVSSGWLKPFKAILKKKGAVLMLLVAFIWSITANFDKLGINASSPYLWGVAIHLFISLGILPLVLKKGSKLKKDFKSHWLLLLGLGIIPGIGLLSQYVAFKLTLVPYVISLKRMTILFSVAFGGVFFKEKKIKQKLLSAAIMVAGAILITFSGI